MDAKLPKIRVKMLGGFSISCGDKTITEKEGRTKKVWLLLEYILANRNKDISLESLIDSVWEDEELEDPFNVLKNLVYRARKLLNDLIPDKKIEYIRFARNTYSWNNELDCSIDIEDFETYLKLADESKDDIEKQIKYYNTAVDLYRGEFLPKSSYANWVISKNAYYSSIYNEGIRKLCSLLLKQERYNDIVIVCEKSISIYMFDDEIHKLLLYSLLKTGRKDKAKKHYDYILDLFYKELNVNISGAFREIYKEIISSDNIETDLNIIKEDLQDACDYTGAFYCDYDIFKNIYRLQARSMQRTGQSINIGLMTVDSIDAKTPEGEYLKRIMQQLRGCIINSLRKSDTVSQFSSTQYVIILPVTTLENGEMVLNRIKNRFYKTYCSKANVSLSYKINTIDPVL